MKPLMCSIFVITLLLPQVRAVDDELRPQEPTTPPKKRELVDTGETPPDNGRTERGSRSLDAKKLKRVLDFSTFSLAEINKQLDILATDTYKTKISKAGLGTKAGEYYRAVTDNEGLTRVSVIKKLSKSISLQCSLGATAGVFQLVENLGVLRVICWDMYNELERLEQRNFLISLLASIEIAIFLKGCPENINRGSLLQICTIITESLTQQNLNHPPDASLMKARSYVLQICNELEDQMTSEESSAVAILAKTIGYDSTLSDSLE